MTSAKAIAVLLLLALCLPARAQRPDSEPAKPGPNPPAPTVSFNFELAGATPSHYSIAVESTGGATYHSDAPQQEAAEYRTPGGAPGDPYSARFTVSRASRERIFALAEKLNYFQGNFDYTKGRIANTGSKTLIYADSRRHHETTYNWSQNLQIEELTRLFQGLSNTLEFGRRLEHLYHFSKLGLDGELKLMEQAEKDNNLVELQVVAPILTRIAQDTSVMHIARLRAQRLLAKTPESAGDAGGQASR